MWGCWSRAAELDLAKEALGAERAGELGVEDLEGHRPVVAEVLGEVDGGHAAAPELAVEPVAVGQRGAQAVPPVAHAGPQGSGSGMWG